MADYVEAKAHATYLDLQPDTVLHQMQPRPSTAIEVEATGYGYQSDMPPNALKLLVMDSIVPGDVFRPVRLRRL